ncbi:hypothetical protein L828_3205 [Mycobacteroides abscessus MAB_030201_1061]|nr:hypothetical protein L835_3135 [Mycobacteroides abscessus MAB_110811_1470]ETZ92829.1 hypothetical protein L828_3205 [Mycobacteroides abscessus MAB_030201_1061]
MLDASSFWGNSLDVLLVLADFLDILRREKIRGALSGQ